MNTPTILLIGGAVLLVIFFLIAKLAIRWAVRLTIVGVILIALLGGAGFLWWTNNLSSRPKPNRPTPAPSRPSSTR
jgi:predicted benzoate:H+ symporter BenE